MIKSISGIRGIVGEDLGLDDVMGFCGGFSGLVSGECVIARDTRPSGAMIKEAAAAVLMREGIRVLDLGMMPTPVLFYEARKYGAGVMVSASHNPIEWNGLKFAINGRGINESELHAVVSGRGRGGDIQDESHIGTDYTEKALDVIGDIAEPPRILVDAGGGAAAAVAPGLLKRLGCDVRVINDNLENCSRGPDPTRDNLAEMLAGCSGGTGFAFDLDGDRLVVARDGKRQAPDATLGLGVAKAQELGHKKFVLSMDTSVSVERLIRDGGGTVYRSKVGEANVIQAMQDTGARAGGEGSSAGFVLSDFNYCRDGILAGGLIASMDDARIREVLEFVNGYCQLREKVPADPALHEGTLERVAQKMGGEFGQMITTDGIKGIIDENTWVLARRSNTENVIRVSAESDDPEKARSILDKTVRMVKKSYEEIR